MPDAEEIADRARAAGDEDILAYIDRPELTD